MRRPKTYILDEEEHLENLRKIIKRDFFGGQRDQQDNSIIPLSLNNYVSNFKSDENQVFTELVKENDQEWKQQHAWLQKTKKLMLQAAPESKPFKNMLGKDPNIKHIDFCNVDQEPQNAVFFNNHALSKSYLHKDHHEAKKIVYKNVRLQENINYQSFLGKRKGIDYQDLQEVPDTPILEGRQKLKDRVNDEYSMKRAPSPTPEQVPIMTWGQVQSTPLRLNSNDFRIQQTPKRDKLLDQLNSKITKEKLIKKSRKDQIKMKILSSVRAGGSSIRKVSMQRFDSTKRESRKVDQSKFDGLLNSKS